MSKFKVGDKVRVVKAACRFFSLGAEGSVIQVDGPSYRVRFVSGEYDHSFDGAWWASKEQLEIIKPYSSTFTDKAPTSQPTGHTADGSGLQKHSIGDIYPLAVVAYVTDTKVKYTVENLQYGACAGTADGVVRQWDKLVNAYEFASRHPRAYDTGGNSIVWLSGRPVYKNNMLVINKPEITITPTRVVLR